MSARPPLRLTLDLDLDADPIRGSVAPEGGTARSFTGWLELFTALEGERPGASEGEPPDAGARPRG